ncbi:MAG TPA: helix-turn-helix transcriptional regulator [Streptosporangiaceae bacterium]|nr:helix-turn-helix transcriptional regulator [Streptosporangiaceae bacterium]
MSMNSAVERAIGSIWERYREPLSLTDIAKSAILSRFHFSRVFREVTGLSPGRYLSAVRIYEAKRLLVSTSLSVTDISFEVGYNSLGSFTNRFTESVGISPARFRRMSKYGAYEMPSPVRSSSRFCGAVAGSVRLPREYIGARVYVATFKNPIVQGQPVSAAIVEVTSASRSASYRLTDVPAGAWFVQAVAVADTADPEPWTRRSLLVAGQGCYVNVIPDVVVETDIYLRPRRRTDVPILLALPELETEPILLALRDPEVEPIPAGVGEGHTERGWQEAHGSPRGIDLLGG